MRAAKCGDLIFVPKEPNLEHVFQQQIHKRDAGRVVHQIRNCKLFIKGNVVYIVQNPILVSKMSNPTLLSKEWP